MGRPLKNKEEKLGKVLGTRVSEQFYNQIKEAGKKAGFVSINAYVRYSLERTNKKVKNINY